MIVKKFTIKWLVGHQTSVEAPSEWVPAKVPGAVQLDWAKAKGWESHTDGDNWKDYEWMEDVFWTYRAVIGELPADNNERVFFVSKGIDYAFSIFLDGEELHRQQGMFTPVEIELTGKVENGSVFEVKIDPVPKAVDEPADRMQASESCKPAVSYGWDWHPRLIPSGIWDDTYLEVRGAQFLKTISSEVTVSEDLQTGFVCFDTEISRVSDSASSIEVTLLDASATSIAQKLVPSKNRSTHIELEVQQPQLWWPHDHGTPYLYELNVKLLDLDGTVLDTKTQRIGFRRVRLVMNDGSWSEPSTFPKTRSVPPITLEINNRRIFAKGSNWVNPDVFPGAINRATYEPLVRLAEEGNMNLFRIWGGAIVNKSSFYELCDELGIMVWTEFPLACNSYPDNPAYLEVLEQESHSIIERIRPHASNVIWCGGNELFNSWSSMTDQSHALRLLNSQCYALDRSTPFMNTSPLMGMAHGHYAFREDKTGREVYEVFQSARNSAYTEFGMPGPSDVDYLESFIPETDLFPPKYNTAWESHHGLGAWGGLRDSWLAQPTIEHYFGKLDSLKALVQCGQWLQCEGYKAIYEEARRQQPYCSMALNWCYNEPWPSAANNNLINWPHHPKPAYHAVKDSCRPVLLSVRITKFVWKAGELFEAEIWLLNDTIEAIPSDEVVVTITVGTQIIEPLVWKQPAAREGENLQGPSVRCLLPDTSGKIHIAVTSREYPERSSTYRLLLQSDLEDRVTKSRELNI